MERFRNLVRFRRTAETELGHSLCRCHGCKIQKFQEDTRTLNMYWNFKGFFSIPVITLVGADYKFIWIKINGKKQDRCLDIWILRAFNLLKENVTGLHTPDDSDDHQGNTIFILKDDPFVLRHCLIQPCSRKCDITVQ